MVERFLDPVGEPILWFLVVIIFGIIAIYFISKYRKMEKGSRSFILGIVFFTAFFMISRTIETIRRYFGIGSYYDIIDSNFSITGLNLVLRLLFYVTLWAGIGILYFVFEKYVMIKRTKYLLTIFSIIAGVTSCAIYLTAMEYWIFLVNATCFFIAGLFPIALFAYCSYTAINKSQRIAWIVLIIGFIFLLLGVLGDTPEAFMVTENLPQIFVHYFTPLAQAVGAIVMAYGLSTIYKAV